MPMYPCGIDQQLNTNVVGRWTEIDCQYAVAGAPCYECPLFTALHPKLRCDWGIGWCMYCGQEAQAVDDVCPECHEGIMEQMQILDQEYAEYLAKEDERIGRCNSCGAGEQYLTNGYCEGCGYSIRMAERGE